MSPSPPFPSPLLAPHSSSSSPHPGIIGDHRPSALQHHLHQGAGEPSNGELRLQLLQGGSNVQQQLGGVSNGGGGGGGGGGCDQQQHSHYSFSMPGIVSRGGDISMAAWDPAVAALGPSHSYSHNGYVGGAVGSGDAREFLPGLCPASPYNASMGSGWLTHQQKQIYPSPPSAASFPSSLSSSLSSSVDLRLIQGRSGGHTFVPIPGAMPPSLYGGHVEMLHRRSAEWRSSPAGHHHQQQQEQFRGMLIESDVSPNPLNLPSNRGTSSAERGPNQRFFGDGADLMKLLQVSSNSSASADQTVERQAVPVGSSVQKMSPAIAHGPIGPPKRSETVRSSPADDLLGRFWPALPVSISNGSQDTGNFNNLKVPSFPFKENEVNLGSLGAPNDRGRWGEHPGDILGGGESILLPSFGNREGAPRFSLASRLYPAHKGGVPDNFEYHDGRGLLGGWSADFFDDSVIGVQQYRKSSGFRPRESVEPTLNLNSNHHDAQHLDGPSKESESEFPRDSNGRGEGIRGGTGGRRGPGSRVELGGRRGGRSGVGQWVAVHDKQREREGVETSGPNEGGAESGSEKGSSSTTNSCKDETISFAKDGCGSIKSRDDLKRRRGQQQEWRMKTPPSHTQHQSPVQCSVPKLSDFSPGSESPELVNGSYRLFPPFKIRPLALQVDHPGLPSNVGQDSPCMSGPAVEMEKKLYHDRGGYNGSERNGGSEEGLGKEDEEELAEAFTGYLDLGDRETGHRQGLHLATAQDEVDNETQQEHMSDFRRHPHRTHAIPSLKPEMRYRPDLEKFTSQMLAMYLSLIPTEEEERRRKQFLSHLDQLVAREWPGAALFLFGSCANAFGVCNSDIDVCLSISDDQLSKADLVLKMAAILRSDNMQNVQALIYARVPIVKFTDPTTGISCDICVNNMLAVVNSKLLHDYSQIDGRLRQLAFLVKHWAKRRQVNETYRGTLSSYAYVLMCIHFLQQRKPAILPCLQEMRPTYRVSVGSIECAYYDQVDTLQNFGIDNKETLGELLTSFFEYWAFRHDYNRAVVSVRTGGYLSKDEKEWTRRIGNERHLICIEDPLETVHDLGRVVDRHSIRVLRDEFHRAAKILRHDLNPCTTLFEPFIREKP